MSKLQIELSVQLYTLSQEIRRAENLTDCDLHDLIVMLIDYEEDFKERDEHNGNIKARSEGKVSC